MADKARNWWDRIGVDVEGRDRSDFPWFKESLWRYLFDLADNLKTTATKLARRIVTEKNGAALFSGLVGSDLKVSDAGDGFLRFSSETFGHDLPDGTCSIGSIDLKPVERYIAKRRKPTVITYLHVLSDILAAKPKRSTKRRKLALGGGGRGWDRWAAYIVDDGAGFGWSVYLSNDKEAAVSGLSEAAAMKYVQSWVADEIDEHYPEYSICYGLDVEGGVNGDVVIANARCIDGKAPEIGSTLRGKVIGVDLRNVPKLGYLNAYLSDRSEGFYAESRDRVIVAVASELPRYRESYRLIMEPKPRRPAPWDNVKRR